MRIFVALAMLLVLTGCGAIGFNNNKNKKNSYKAEESYCYVNNTFDNAFTLTGSATFTAWVATVDGLETTVTKPIRRAEVRVVNGSGKIVQCGFTNNSGQYSLQVGKAAGNYTIQIHSRADNEFVKVSVLNNPTDNIYYRLSTDLSYDGAANSIAASTLNASHVGNIYGGAFNIFDQILEANEFLRTKSSECPSCTQYTVAPKLRIYWAPGFNPYSYYGVQDVGLSFYSSSDSPNERELFILGGIRGDTQNSDTDHFDNSVILHEYGHYLENIYARSDSPGGKHNGNIILDPRLSWSEGWANFLQAAVSGENSYIDTTGNATGVTSTQIDFDLETKLSSQDFPTVNGEGVYREISVTRTLVDIIQESSSDEDGYYAEVPFGYLWTAFAGPTGMSESVNNFRNSGLFLKLLRGVINDKNSSLLTDFDSVVTFERQSSTLDYYAAPLAAGSCSAIAIRGVKDTTYYNSDNSTYDMSNLFHSNDFYSYYHPGGTLNISLNYTKSGDPGSQDTDLDLYIYKKDYEYGVSSTILTKSNKYFPESSGNGYEVINLNAPAGQYLINVRVFTTDLTTYQIGGPAVYTIYNGGTQLCP